MRGHTRPKEGAPRRSAHSRAAGAAGAKDVGRAMGIYGASSQPSREGIRSKRRRKRTTPETRSLSGSRSLAKELFGGSGGSSPFLPFSQNRWRTASVG